MKKRSWYVTYEKPGNYVSQHAVILAANVAVALTKWQKRAKLPDSAVTEIREISASFVKA